MTRFTSLLGAFGLLGSLATASAQDADFSLTYHVERIPAARLSIEACGQAVVDTAAKTGMRHTTQSYPDQLVTVSGGEDSRGAFIAQCIVVGDTTVSVIQGIDYQQQKGALGDFADQAFAAVKAAAE